MADSQSIGNAYINIKPKMDSSFESEVKGAGEQSGGFFGSTFSVMAGNLLADGIQKIAGAAADTFRQGFEGYANYEQLLGGVETLFKDSAGTVQENASNAFKTAGMSANEYMETVTGFSASLLQGLGGDTQKAAEYADMAVRDMSDNANKMGTDMGRITDAYQGFAKGNYTMLDNLKLGYGGTKTEMERLLADASKIAGVEFNIDNYNDVIEAIHVMQENMGIAGTTALEAEHTISGSIDSLKGAWDNFLVGIFDENADMGVLGEQLFTAIGTVLQNVVPRIGTAIVRIVQTLPGVISEALTMLPSMLEPVLTAVFGDEVGGKISEILGGSVGGMAETFGGLFESLGTTLTTLWETAQPIVELLASLFAVQMASIMQAVKLVVDFVTNNVLPLVNSVLQTVQPVIEKISASLQEKMPAIQQVVSNAMNTIKDIISKVWPVVQDVVTTVVRVISELIETAWPAISAIIDTAMKAIDAIITHVWPVVAEAIKAAMTIIKGIIETVWPVVRGIVETVCGAIKAVVETAWPIISGIVETAAGAIKGAIEGIETVVSVVQGIFDGIRRAIEDPIGTARGFIEDAINAIKGFFNFDIQWPHIPLPHFNVSGSPNPLDWLEGGLPSISIDWYAKGGFVDGATLIGAGEAGPEMILPRQGALMDDFAGRIAARVGGGVDIHDCTFNVREESDIRKVAQELNKLISRQTAGGFS